MASVVEVGLFIGFAGAVFVGAFGAYGSINDDYKKAQRPEAGQRGEQVVRVEPLRPGRWRMRRGV